MHSEIAARVTRKTNNHIELQIVRDPCAGCNGRCSAFFLVSSANRPIPVSNACFKLNSGDFSVGQQVRAAVPIQTLIGLSSLVYLTPLVLMLLSAVVCFKGFSQSDIAIAASAAFGLIGGLIIVRFLLAIVEKKQAVETLFIRHDTDGHSSPSV